MNAEALERMGVVLETYDLLSQDGEGRVVQQ
jgi:hypothetical protein